jgi:hypothetical protein
MRLNRRATRRLRRNALFIGAVLALCLVVFLAFELAPQTDDTPKLRVPAVSD